MSGSNIAIRKRRDTTTDLASITPLLGEYWVDITKPTLVVGDGSTAGGIPMAKESHTHPDATTGTDGFMSAADKVKLNALSEAGGVQRVSNNFSDLPAETTLEFDTNFTLTDDSGNGSTNVTLSTTFLNTINSNNVALIVALS